MVATEVREARRPDPDAVQPPLVEAMRRRLHRGMVDAGLGDFGKRPVKRDRLGRGVNQGD
jgi:hypothetical protein